MWSWLACGSGTHIASGFSEGLRECSIHTLVFPRVSVCCVVHGWGMAGIFTWHVVTQQAHRLIGLSYAVSLPRGSYLRSVCGQCRWHSWSLGYMLIAHSRLKRAVGARSVLAARLFSINMLYVEHSILCNHYVAEVSIFSSYRTIRAFLDRRPQRLLFSRIL